MRQHVCFAVATATLLSGAVARADDLDAAGSRFLAALDADQRSEAVWGFDDAERTDIHYAPIGLDGLRHGDLEASALDAAQALLAAALSVEGLARVDRVRALEAVVHAQANPVLRLAGLFDPGRYFWAVFGEPAAPPWAFRFEGHHLSLNVTVTPAGVSTTPLFIGAQPRVVPDGLDVGPPAGTAVLAEQERLARELYGSLNDAQRARATLPYQDDRGLTIGQVARVDAPQQPVGVPRGDLDAGQRDLLDALAGSLAGLWAADIAAARRADIAAATAGLHFAFAAAAVPPNSFYARVSAPSLLIEIDNTEGGDHVHAVWHQPGGDFADDLLARHLAADHGISLVRR